MKRALFVAVFAVISLSASAQFSELQTIEIGSLSTTHIIFTSDLSYVDISKQEAIAAKVVDASKNMLALKAREPFDYVTTISALEANGTMHTFKVKYNPFPAQLVVDTRAGQVNQQNGTVNTQIRPTSQVQQEPSPQVQDGNVPQPVAQKNPVYKPSQSPVISSVNIPGKVNVTSDETSNFGKADAPTLEEIMKIPQQLFHIGDKCYKLEAYVTNIFVYSDLLYVVITLANKSDIGFETGDAQFTIENLKAKRELVTEKSVWAKSFYGNLSCPPRGTTTIGYTIPKMTLLKNECLKIYIYEKRGTRNLLLTLNDKDINYAVSPK